MGFDGLCCFLSESPCCAGWQNLVLPQSALTHSSANTELHLKLWSCCPCRTPCQATPQTREIRIRERYFSLFPCTWDFSAFSHFPPHPSCLHHVLLTSFPISSLSLLLPLLPPCISSMKHCGKYSSHTSHSRIPGSCRIPHAGGSVSQSVCGCWGLWGRVTMRVCVGGTVIC